MIFRISYMKQKMLTIEIVLTDLLYANINFGAGLQSLSRFFFFRLWPRLKNQMFE